ncbi:hypothetical protein [Amycolatopsis jiangsuensis]|uniref:Uncharacterized protein n=1 Tax=Amycolatopsis jiangsuensis TaxID=1181879 RepID=A0A840J2I3_9PSEU|nr:hypothetical protein [Amycolatopsis jiangsuensis]MBB4689236.1 hypothetical protein [Amycolatopsis jiangsuensis]
MGYKFSLVLNRELTDEETVALKGAIRADVSFGDDTLPTDAAVAVAKLDIDDEVSPTLAESIEAAFEAVRGVEGLSVPGLSVPAQPAGPASQDAPADSEPAGSAA